MQVDEVGGGDLRWMAAFRHASQVEKVSIVNTQRYTVQLQSSKSYTRQSVDLLRQPIELETLDIFTMDHDAIADRVDLHNELSQGISLL